MVVGGQLVAAARRRGADEDGDPGKVGLGNIDAALHARAEAVSRYVDEHLGLKPGRRIMVDVDALAAGRAAGRLVPLPGGEGD